MSVSCTCDFSSADALNPKDAREAAKKLLESGVSLALYCVDGLALLPTVWGVPKLQKLMIKSKVAVKKTSGFKRVGEGASRVSVG